MSWEHLKVNLDPTSYPTYRKCKKRVFTDYDLLLDSHGTGVSFGCKEEPYFENEYQYQKLNLKIAFKHLSYEKVKNEFPEINQDGPVCLIPGVVRVLRLYMLQESGCPSRIQVCEDGRDQAPGNCNSAGHS